MRNLGDYARDTQHLSPLEHGFYNLLLDRYYAKEEPIRAKDVYRVAKAKGRAEHKIVDAILGEFFERRGEVYYSRRCQQEITRYRERSAKAKDSANARWHPEGNTTGMRTHSEGNAIRNPLSVIQDKEKESEGKNALSESRMAQIPDLRIKESRR